MNEIPILIKTKEIEELLSIRATVTMRAIIDFVCYETGLEESKLISRDKSRELADARHLIFYMAYKKRIGTTSVIGRYLQRNHATVTHAVGKIKDLKKVDSEIRNRVDKMEFMFN